MKGDITNRMDIEQLINAFYDKVKKDDVIGFIFNDIAKVNWEMHLPMIYNFWENILFFTGSYNGTPMLIHQNLNKLITLTKEHFERWLKLFSETVDELFEGKKADLASQRAISISGIIKGKILEYQATDQQKLLIVS